jgi:hypothetical protein
VTNDHALSRVNAGVSTLTLVLDAGLKTQKVLKAEVIRRDKVLDLALLKVEAQPAPMTSLALGSDEELDELKELTAFGFPFGTTFANKPGQFPAISVNRGNVTSLRRDEKGELDRIQLDAELNPGNSGGPILDVSGKVVGVTVSGIQGTGINLAIPVSHVKRFLARPEILFKPPVVEKAKAQQSVEFRADLVSVLPATSPYELELAIGPPGKEKRLAMKPQKGGFAAKAVAFPSKEGPVEFRLSVNYGEGQVSGTVSDRKIRLGSESVQLSQVRRIVLAEKVDTTLWDGRTLEGPISGLETVPIRVGPQALDVKIAGAKEINLQAPDPTNLASCTIVARQGGKEVGSLASLIYLEGAEDEQLNAIRDGHFSRPLRSSSPVTYLRAYSTPGDWVGQGKNYSFNGDEMTSQRDLRGFIVTAGGFNFQFGGPSNQFLEAKEYLDAKRHGFSGEAPGLAISGNGRGANMIDGKFAVWEFAFKNNEVLRLAIDFSQQSDSKPPAFYGKIRINSNFH